MITEQATRVDEQSRSGARDFLSHVLSRTEPATRPVLWIMWQGYLRTKRVRR